MHFKPHIEIPMWDGPAFFDPKEVVMVLKSGDVSRLVLSGGHEVPVNLSSEAAAKKLWRFTNAANDGAFFNDEHVVAVVPYGDGCRLLFTQGGDLEIATPAHVMIEGLRAANAQRNAIAGQA